MALAELAVLLATEFSVFEEMPHLAGGFAAPEDGGVEAGEDDVVGFAAEIGVRLGDHQIELGSNDANFRQIERRQRTDKAVTLVGELGDGRRESPQMRG